MSSVLLGGLARYMDGGTLARLAVPRVGVLGCGGIGSNVVLFLARSGVRRFLLVDFDRVEASNLNRQCYFPGDLGRLKAEALRDHVLSLDPAIEVETRVARVNTGPQESGLSSADPRDPKPALVFLAALLPLADFWVEALDGADDKRRFAETCLTRGVPAVGCSGMGGLGRGEMRVRTVSCLDVVGDFASDVADHPPLAPRVAACAAIMADRVLCRLLEDGA